MHAHTVKECVILNSHNVHMLNITHQKCNLWYNRNNKIEAVIRYQRSSEGNEARVNSLAYFCLIDGCQVLSDELEAYNT